VSLITTSQLRWDVVKNDHMIATIIQLLFVGLLDCRKPQKTLMFFISLKTTFLLKKLCIKIGVDEIDTRPGPGQFVPICHIHTVCIFLTT
jgi:hypothetical protein